MLTPTPSRCRKATRPCSRCASNTCRTWKPITNTATTTQRRECRNSLTSTRSHPSLKPLPGLRREPNEMELTDESILLRPYCEADAEHLHAAVRESIPEVSRWLPWCHENYSLAESRDFVASRRIASQGDEWYSFAIFENSSGAFVGGVGLNFINRVHQFANLGYWIRTSAAGRGFATGATRLAARFGFAQLGLRRIEIVAAVNNVASQR